MHWVIPFAGSASPGAAKALNGLALPRLERLLALLGPSMRDEGDVYALNPPHERALARAWGWPPAADGLLPLAVEAARADGLQPSADGQGWALVSPCHWHLGTEQVSLADPAELALPDDEARALFDTLRPLAESDGCRLLWGTASRWYLVHPRLAALPTASVDRVVGRNVDLWLNSHPEARGFRRLQAEAQMLWHTHPLNAEREGRGLLPVNSFWLSGTGPNPPPARREAVRVADALRAPALAEDWAAWAHAWAALDAGPITNALEAAERGQPVALTLCGERHSQRFEPRTNAVWRRWLAPRRKPAAPWLQAL